MTQTLYCSFCRKADSEVARLIVGPAVFICNACVAHCVAILERCPLDTPQPADRIDWPCDAPTETLLGLLKGQESTLRDVRDRVKVTVDLLRAREVSWEKIGRALGCSRQAAWERFG